MLLFIFSLHFVAKWCDWSCDGEKDPEFFGRSLYSLGGGYHATNAISVEKRYNLRHKSYHNPSHTNLNCRCKW